MTSRPNYNTTTQPSLYASPSQFLQNSFAPFAGSSTGGNDRHQNAPLFFSTLDASGRGSDHGDDYYNRQSDIQEREDEDEDENHGLGKTSYASEDEESNNPFTSRSASRNATRPRPGRSSSSVSASSSTIEHHLPLPRTGHGWRMHGGGLSGLPSIKQSVINDIYDQAESIYSSVFMGNANAHEAAEANPALKGKASTGSQQNGSKELSKQLEHGRSRHHDDADDNHDSEPPPEFLEPNQPTPPSLPAIHRASSKSSTSGAISLPSESSYPVYDVNDPSAASRRIHRYPMPTIRYRRIALNIQGAMTESTHPLRREPLDDRNQADFDYQDQAQRDSSWSATYLLNLTVTGIIFLYLHLIDSPHYVPDSSTSILVTPSLALLHSIPLLSIVAVATVLISGSLLASLFLLRNSIRRMMTIILLLPPVLLVTASAWLFASSFTFIPTSSTPNDEIGEISGASSPIESFLRWSSLVVLIPTLLYIRYSLIPSMSSRKVRLERTVRILEISCDFLLLHPTLFALAFGLLLAFLITTIPFLLTISKLLVHGYFIASPDSATGEQRKQQPYLYLIPSAWSSVFTIHTLLVFFWTAGVLRAILRSSVAGSMGDWWFNTGVRPELPTSEQKGVSARQDLTQSGTLAQSILSKSVARKRKVSSTKAAESVSSALRRSVGPSFGTLCASAFITAVHSTMTSILFTFEFFLRRLSRYTVSTTGTSLHLLIIRAVLSWIIIPLATLYGTVLHLLSGFALAYASITGDRYMQSITEAKALINDRNGTDPIAAHIILGSLINLLSIAIAAISSVIGYLTVASSIPQSDTSSMKGYIAVTDMTFYTPLLVALLFGVVPYWTIRLAGDLLSNAVDAAFVCFNIDLDMGVTHNMKAFEAFALDEKEILDDSDDESMTEEQALDRAERGT